MSDIAFHNRRLDMRLSILEAILSESKLVESWLSNEI